MPYPFEFESAVCRSRCTMYTCLLAPDKAHVHSDAKAWHWDFPLRYPRKLMTARWLPLTSLGRSGLSGLLSSFLPCQQATAQRDAGTRDAACQFVHQSLPHCSSTTRYSSSVSTARKHSRDLSHCIEVGARLSFFFPDTRIGALVVRAFYFNAQQIRVQAFWMRPNSTLFCESAWVEVCCFLNINIQDMYLRLPGIWVAKLSE